ncbi:MAG: MepB family protein, partial [Ignavibacteria bacterium]|nr:MepB family protein [Ignavibacteria bacterium]
MRPESLEYCACQFSMNRRIIEYRESKITPIKIGQFVTVWRRNKLGIIVPFDSLDAIDFVIIFAKNNYNSGQFIFPKSTLIEKQILSKNGNGGKLGFRVYPPWDKPTSKQAVKTQSWQTKYFLSIERDGTCDLNRAKHLFSNTA